MASCKHVSAYRNRQTCRAKFARLQRALLSLWQQDDDSKERRVQSEQTPIVCLHCACASRSCQHHSRQHYAQARTGHELAVDLQHDQLYCGACNAYVSDAMFDSAVKAARSLACYGIEDQQSVAMPGSTREAYAENVQAMPALLKRKRHQSDEEDSVHPKRLCTDKTNPPAGVSHDFAAGLRGLNNLGNTCFMNSVLQVFVHVPLLQAYFLGGGHMHKLCPHQSPPDKPGKCLSCELDKVFAEAFSGNRSPFSPVRFLDTWWRSAEGSLAGYQQQDAHEFYLSLLDGLGQAADRSATPSVSGRGSPSPTPTAKSATPPLEGGEGELLDTAPSLNIWGPAGGRRKQPGKPVIDLVTSSSSEQESSRQGSPVEDIESVMDQIFGGILRSDVVCTACGDTSTAHDPFKDISLDIPEPLRHTPPPPPVDTPKPNPIRSSGKGKASGNGRGSNGKGLKGSKQTALTGVKRKAEVLFQKDWDNMTEASEPAPSEVSGFPATTETSHRYSSADDQSSVAGRTESERDQTVSSPLHPSATPHPTPSDAPSSKPAIQPKSAAAAGKKEKDTPIFSAKAAASAAADEIAAKEVAGAQHESPGAVSASVGISQGKGKGQGTGKGPRPGQRPITAPASPAGGKIQKPTRCQTCHTCRNKQLKKQCLRNKALSSPTKRNIEDALSGGVEAAELTAILPAHLQPPDSRDLGARQTQAAESAEPRKLAPVLHGPKYRQAAIWQPPSALSKPHLGPLDPQKPAQPQDLSQQHDNASGRAQQLTNTVPQPAGVHAGDDAVAAAPVPMPVKADPSQPPPSEEAAQVVAQQQQQQQQQQQGALAQDVWQHQTAALSGEVDLAQQARDSFQRSTSQVDTRTVDDVSTTDSGAALLQACLHRFVRPESLHRWKCSRCQCERSALKQMSIRQLPPVLCLHVKRFKATDKGTTKKVESRVAFPVAHLDMAPFTSAPVLAARCHLGKGALLGAAPGQSGTTGAHGSTAYRLHAAVCHTGNLLGGHYIGYVRCGQHWYQFDDARVTLVPEEYVRLSNVYMLFYLQK